MLSKLKIKSTWTNKELENLKQDLLFEAKEIIQKNKYYFKVYFPTFDIFETNEAGIAFMTHIPSKVNININNTIDYFLSDELLYTKSKYVITKQFKNFVLGLIAHEFGHVVVTLDYDTWKMYYNKMNTNMPLNFLMHIVNVVDDTVLQHVMSNLHYSFKEPLYSLATYGQGYIQYINYLSEEESNLQNKLYFLILYAYKDTHKDFFEYNNYYSDKFFDRYNIIDRDNLYTKNLLNEFNYIRTVDNVYTRQKLIFEFAQKLYNLLLNDYKQEQNDKSKAKGEPKKSDQQLESDFNNALNEALEQLEKSKNIKNSNVKKSNKKANGKLPIAHTIVNEDSKIFTPEIKQKLKKLYSYSKDSLTNIMLNNDIGIKRNLKNGLLDSSNIPYSSIKTNVFYRDSGEINIPDLTMITLVDCSGSMSYKIKNFDISFYDYVTHMISFYQASFIERFKETKIVNLTFNTSVFYVNDNYNSLFNLNKTLEYFKAADNGGGTNPHDSLDYINDLVDTITTKSKMLLIVTDGEFDETPEIKKLVKSIQQKIDLVLVINLTGQEFKVFKDKTIVLNYDESTIKNCYLQLSKVIEDTFIMKGGD